MGERWKIKAKTKSRQQDTLGNALRTLMHQRETCLENNEKSTPLVPTTPTKWRQRRGIQSTPHCAISVLFIWGHSVTFRIEEHSVLLPSDTRATAPLYISRVPSSANCCVCHPAAQVATWRSRRQETELQHFL